MNTPKTITITESHMVLDKLLEKKGTHKQFVRGIRNYTMALLMLDAGLRVGEVIHLHDRDLYFNCEPVKSIIISPEIAKNNREREIPVSERLSKALKSHLGNIGRCFSDPGSKYVFFKSDRRRPLTTRQVERIIRRAAFQALGKPIHPHILRHTFASKLMRKVDMRTVQMLLGHSSLASTQIYTHPNQDDLRKAVLSLGDERSQKASESLTSGPGAGPADHGNAAGANHNHSH